MTGWWAKQYPWVSFLHSKAARLNLPACEISEEVLTLCQESIAFMKKLMLRNPKKTNITPESQPRLQKSWDLVRPLLLVGTKSQTHLCMLPLVSIFYICREIQKKSKTTLWLLKKLPPLCTCYLPPARLPAARLASRQVGGGIAVRTCWDLFTGSGCLIGSKRQRLWLAHWGNLTPITTFFCWRSIDRWQTPTLQLTTHHWNDLSLRI